MEEKETYPFVINVKTIAGQSIKETCYAAARLSKQLGCLIETEINDVTITVGGLMTEQDAYESWLFYSKQKNNNMNERPTPETDEYAKADWWTLFRATEHGRILERERDEARELLASEKITRNYIIKRSVEVERERDEAREETVQLLESSNRLISLLREQLTEARELCQELIDLVPFGLGQSDQPWSSQAIKNNIAAIKNKEHNCDFFKDMKGNCMACRP